ncbi:MAG: chorismate synthase [Acidaminococcus sp.]|uniref:chorismate synthase n=1 Tax=Acidaminococcus sp. TaxID=1872103 RepID=UPI003F13B82D
MSSVMGERIKLTIFGESHGPSIGVVMDGLPAGVELDLAAIEKEMKRRAPGSSKLATPRKEADSFTLESGFFNGKTTGMALCARIANTNAHSRDYSKMKEVMRPGHGDYPGYVKFHGCNDYRGGGTFSGRLTAPLVFAGAVAKQLLAQKGVTVGAHVAALAGIKDKRFNPLGETAETLRSMAEETLPVLDAAVREPMAQAVTAAQKEKDSVGGLIECMAIGLPVGLGEPYFDSVESRLSHALFSVPAVKGIAFGDGFGLAEMRGSEANDPMEYKDGKVVCTTNHNGGVTGGISNGMPLVFTLVIKPTPSIGKTQHTVNVVTKEDTTIEVTGRHDPCILPRAIPVVEAVTAWTLLDLFYMAERG